MTTQLIVAYLKKTIQPKDDWSLNGYMRFVGRTSVWTKWGTPVRNIKKYGHTRMK